jgi:hypothetical protein
MGYVVMLILFSSDLLVLFPFVLFGFCMFFYLVFLSIFFLLWFGNFSRVLCLRCFMYIIVVICYL